MKLAHWVGRVVAVCFLLQWLAGGLTTAAQAADGPAIVALERQGNGAKVVVKVPKGVRRVILQEYAKAKGWENRAIAHTDGSGGRVSFRVPAGTHARQLRVEGSASDLFPAGFYKGKKNFAKVSRTKPAASNVAAPTNLAGAAANGVSTGSGTAAGNTSTRTVTEADIWKISGNTLYFFNQYRGLQVIDITNPDSPVRLGTLHLPAVGEDLYVVDPSHVILLASEGGDWNSSEVIDVTITNGVPSITQKLPLTGYIDTSRLVGTALYVATNGWLDTAANPGGEWGTQVSSFDFSNPEAPVARTTLWLPGYNNTAMATDTDFFVADTTDANWSQSEVNIIDISAADGTIVMDGTVQAAGIVEDQFGMAQNGSVFSVVSQMWNTGANFEATSELQTFSIANPAAPAALGSLAIAPGEALSAAAFSGTVAYIMTSAEVDPLLIVDLSNPAAPAVVGSVDVPGYSTYIEPLGTQLITLGVVNSQVAVSLYDVHDPTQPSLVSQLTVGGTYSWSEANFDEQAFAVLPDAGLILLPVDSYDPSTGEASQVQLIDFGQGTLTKRGVINQSFQPRRATVLGNRILSISGRDLLTVDATNQDQPTVTSDLALAWPVDHVFAQGNYLVEIEDGSQDWLSQGSPVLRVALASDPDSVQQVSALSGAPILGAAVHAGRLYVAQADAAAGWPWMIPLAANGGGASLAASTTGTSGTATSTLTVSIYDLSSLPQLPLLGTVQTTVPALGWNPSLDALWPQDNLLVWAGANRPFFFPILFAGTPMQPMAAGVSATAAGAPAATANAVTAAPEIFPPFWGWGDQSEGRLFAYDVTSGTAPEFLSETDFASGEWNIGTAYTSGSAVFCSHIGAQQTDGGWCWLNRDGTGDSSDGWAQGWYLDVIDFTTPASPVVGAPVSIPGQLVAVSNASANGGLLYTEGANAQDSTGSTQVFAALAYDGVSASLLDSFVLPDWSDPVEVTGSDVLVGVSVPAADANSDPTGAVDTWTLSGAGKLVQIGSASLSAEPYDLRLIGAMLCASTGNEVDLFDATSPADLRMIGSDTGDAYLSLGLDDADGALAAGLWLALGDYGVGVAALGAGGP